MPSGLRRRSSSTGVSCGRISEKTRSSRIRRAISCAYWAPKSRTISGRSAASDSTCGPLDRPRLCLTHPTFRVATVRKMLATRPPSARPGHAGRVRLLGRGVELAQRDGAREPRRVARIERARAEGLGVGGAAADGVA